MYAYTTYYFCNECGIYFNINYRDPCNETSYCPICGGQSIIEMQDDCADLDIENLEEE
jgi:rRNA maturation endonuclease Nob1